MSESGSGEEKGHLVVITGLPESGKTSLAVRLAHSMGAARMCPDDWMKAAGIDLWDADVRSQIERFQLGLTLELLAQGKDVVIEWGVWTREERDALRDAARDVGAGVELRYVTAPIGELWRLLPGASDQPDRRSIAGDSSAASRSAISFMRASGTASSAPTPRNPKMRGPCRSFGRPRERGMTWTCTCGCCGCSANWTT